MLDVDSIKFMEPIIGVASGRKDLMAGAIREGSILMNS
jgi:hypothetical protein